MKASENMTTNYIIAAAIVLAVMACMCVGMVSDAFTAVANIILAPIRWILQLFHVGGAQAFIQFLPYWLI